MGLVSTNINIKTVTVCTRDNPIGVTNLIHSLNYFKFKDVFVWAGSRVYFTPDGAHTVCIEVEFALTVV